MSMFENIYITVAIFCLCFFALLAGGAYFLAQGMKTAQGKAPVDFLSVNKLETVFDRLGKVRKNRILVYISVSVDNLINMYSDSKASLVMSDIKSILLNNFAQENASVIAPHGLKNFVILSCQKENDVIGKIEKTIVDLDKCLLSYNALNLAEIKFGLYSAVIVSQSFDDALNRAKQACIVAENNGTSYAVWNGNMGRTLENKINIENTIDKDIDNNRFFLEYQPIMRTSSKEIIGAEVLSRLNSESNGILTPRSFLEALDSAKLSDKFDYYIFEKNCKWISNNKEVREKYKYSINFSRTTLSDPMFPKRIIEIVEKYGLDYSSLGIEILENKKIDDAAKRQIVRNINALKEKGMLVLLDDFGEGYTSFDDLQNLTIDIVKIDKRLIRNTNTERGISIFHSIIRTAKEIGMKVLCEGIETPEQERIAVDSGCDFLQGFYYYVPMPVARFEKILEEKSIG